ncbi:glycosyltransferase, partial [bacterium]|nr:glycosyltransferase [bacterium]
IPVFNGAKTIRETVESVLKQTLEDFELIAIDDGSTDATLEVLDSICDRRLKVFSYQNAGLAASRNRGLNRATGKYISFIDADDLWTPEKLEAQCQALEENPKAALAYSWTDCIDPEGNFLRHCSYVTWSGYVLPHLLLDDFIGSGSNVAIRREALLELGGFDESLGSAEDTDMWLRLATRYEFVVVPKVQVLYRISPQSMSSNLLKMEETNLRVLQRAFTEAPDSLQYIKSHSMANLYKYLSYKALDAPPGQQKTLITARFLWQAMLGDRSLLYKPVFWKGWLKLLGMVMLPSLLVRSLFKQFPKLANTSTFLGYEKTDITRL